MLKLKSKLLASVLCLGLTPSLAVAAPIEFNYQSSYMGPHIFNVEMGPNWAKKLKADSKNDLIAHYFQDGGLVKSNDLPHSIISGTVDMGSTGLAHLADTTPISLNSAAGFITKDAIHGTALLEKLYNDNKEIQDEQAKVGKVLNMWVADRSAFFSTSGPIKTPADLKGKRVLVWGGSNIAVIKAWGGVPVQVLPSDTYLGLQRGMGEVFLGPIPTGVSYKLMEVAKDVTPITAMTAFVFTWVSWDLWNDMSSTQQKHLEDSTKNWGRELAVKLVDVTNKDLVTMKNAGCTITNLSDAEVKQFADISKKISIENTATEFKRYGVKKDATQWINYVFETSNSIK